ncbi:MAG TPA: hypothetical protein VJV79_12970 [Polyangiaceae bacterium]|nr:hypothetical protein [Polyangiaceae bacterium]
MGEPVYQDAQHVMVICENAILTCSGESPNPRYLEAWARTVELVSDQFPTGLLVLTIIDSRVRPPDDRSKAHIRSTVLRHAAEIQAFAYVVEGEGFGAAAMRSAVSLISLAARYPFPQKVFGHVDEAVHWMLSRPSPTFERRAPDAVKLINAANSLRDQQRTGAALG